MKSESKKVEAADDFTPELPITPMLDLSFQLLFFFIPLFNPTQEGQLDLALPSKEEKAAHNQKDVDPLNKADVEPTTESEYSIVVQSFGGGQNRGDISAVFIENRAGRTPVTTDGNNPTVLAALKTALHKIRHPPEPEKQPGQPPPPPPPVPESIKLVGDSRTKWSEMVRLMDIARGEGFKNVNFGQPSDLDLSAVSQ